MSLVPGNEFAPAPGARAPSVGEELAGLLKACSLGDEAAFAKLYDATGARLFGLVLRTVRDHRNLDGQRVRRALDSLTETQRGALELAYFGGYTHREVAAMMDLPLGTAKTRIRDGLIRLRDTPGLAT